VRHSLYLRGIYDRLEDTVNGYYTCTKSQFVWCFVPEVGQYISIFAFNRIVIRINKELGIPRMHLATEEYHLSFIPHILHEDDVLSVKTRIAHGLGLIKQVLNDEYDADAQVVATFSKQV
jgi:hypothetical protein